MAFLSTKSGSILGALVIAAALIGGAYYFSTAHVAQVNAESGEDALKAYATQDSDNDGLPDWEEALYGTDPHNPDTFNLGMTDGEAVAKGLIKLKINLATTTPAATTSLASEIPGPEAATSSMTAQFAQAFFDNYISTRGDEPPTADEEQQFVEGAVSNLVQTDIRPDTYAESDIEVSGSGAAALDAYAVSAEAAFAAHTVNLPYDELTYFSDAAEKGDTSAIANLQAISQAYTSTAAAIVELPVPQEAAASDLLLVNSMARLGGTIDDLASVQDDPIRALVGLGNYTTDSQAFMAALQQMNADFAADGVTMQPGAPGYYFFHLTQVAVEAASTTTP